MIVIKLYMVHMILRVYADTESSININMPHSCRTVFVCLVGSLKALQSQSFPLLKIPKEKGGAESYAPDPHTHSSTPALTVNMYKIDFSLF